MSGYQTTKPSSPSIAVVILISLATSLLVTSGAFFWFRNTAGASLFESSEVVMVPKVSGKKPKAASAMLKEIGLRMMVEAEREDDGIPEGHIVSQSPLPSSDVETGSVVRVVVSLGLPEIAIPGVESKTKKEAIALLEQAGFTVDPREAEEPPEDAAPGSALRTEPPQGTPLVKGAPVTLYFARSGIVVPDFKGQNYKKALTNAEELGLVRGTIKRRFNGLIRPYTVVAQDPEPETVVPPGTELNLTIND